MMAGVMPGMGDPAPYGVVGHIASGIAGTVPEGQAVTVGSELGAGPRHPSTGWFPVA